MKKTLVAMAVLGLAAGTAQAQSNVTLYGLVDGGLAYVNNSGGNANWKTGDGIQSGNRWGLRGREDLGGGLSAVFTLENGFTIFDGKNGQGQREFGRQAFVGLSSRTAGTVTFGRQYDSVVDFVSPLTSAKQWAGKFGAHVGDADNLYNSFRLDNAVKYTSANYSGFTFGGLYAFSNQGNTGPNTGFGNNRAYSFGARYANGPLKVGVGYLQVNNPNASTAGAVTGDYSGTFYSLSAGGTTVGVTKQRVIGAGASYAFGPASVGLVFTNTRLDYANDSSLRLNNYEINAKYKLTPALLLGAAYTFTDGSGTTNDVSDGKPRYHQVNLGASYSLSKRSNLYLIGIYQKAAGDARHAAILGVGSASSTTSQVAVVAGIRHKF